MLVRALHISAATGEISTIDLGGERLTKMREHLDCRWVECVRLPHDIDLWMDEEYSFREDKQPNYVAATFARQSSGLAWPLFGGDVIVATTDGEGETISLDDSQHSRIEAELKQLRGLAALFAPSPT